MLVIVIFICALFDQVSNTFSTYYRPVISRNKTSMVSRFGVLYINHARIFGPYVSFGLRV